MMAASLNSAMLDSDTFLSSLRFTPKHSHSILILTQTNSICLTWWWQPSSILPCWIQTPCFQPFCSELWLKLIQSDSHSFTLTQFDDGSHLEFGNLGLSHLSFSCQTHSHLPWLVPTICTKKTLTDLFWLNWMDCSHLEFCHLVFRHLVFFSQIHSKTPSLHSDSDSN